MKREDIGRREELLAWVDSAFGDFTSGKPHQVVEQIKEIFWQVDQRATVEAEAKSAARIAELEVKMAEQQAKALRSAFIMSQCLHNVIVGNQSAWIEWQHGKGAEAAMTWIHNGLAGPGHIPDGTDAQAYCDANMDYRYEMTDKRNPLSDDLPAGALAAPIAAVTEQEQPK